MEPLKHIYDYPEKEQLIILTGICNRIYIARNISLNEDVIIKELENIDKLFKDTTNHN